MIQGKYCVTVRYLEKCSPSILDNENLNSYEIIVKKHNKTYEEIAGYVYLPKTYKAARVIPNFIMKPIKNNPNNFSNIS